MEEEEDDLPSEQQSIYSSDDERTAENMAQFTAEEQTVRIIYTELKKVAMQMTEDSKNVKEE